MPKLNITKPAKKPETKKIEMHLKCILTDEEKLAAGRALADAGEAIIRLENDLKRIKKDFESKISAEEAVIGVEQSKIRSGYEYRNVPCLVTYDEPKKGSKTIMRLDLNQVHEVQVMSGDEMQRMLALDAESASTPPPVVPPADEPTGT